MKAVHHGQNIKGIIQEEADRLQLGETGRFPEEPLADFDKGELKFEIAIYDGDKIIINFGKPVFFIGLTAKQANALSELLKECAGIC